VFPSHDRGSVRAFGDECNNSSSPFNKHPEDYFLYEIGLYDDQTGLLNPISPVKMIGCAADFVTRTVTGVPAVVRTDLPDPELVRNGTK